MTAAEHHLKIYLALSAIAFTVCNLYALYQVYSGAPYASWSLYATYVLSGMWLGTTFWTWIDWQDINVRKDNK